MTAPDSFDLLPAPDDVAGPALRPADMTPREAWQWLAAARFRAALDTGKPQGRVALVEYALRETAEGALVPGVQAVDTFDPSHMAEVWAARRMAGLPVCGLDVPPAVVAVEGKATALALALQCPGTPVVEPAQ